MNITVFKPWYYSLVIYLGPLRYFVTSNLLIIIRYYSLGVTDFSITWVSIPVTHIHSIHFFWGGHEICAVITTMTRPASAQNSTSTNDSVPQKGDSIFACVM